MTEMLEIVHSRMSLSPCAGLKVIEIGVNLKRLAMSWQGSSACLAMAQLVKKSGQYPERTVVVATNPHELVNNGARVRNAILSSRASISYP